MFGQIARRGGRNEALATGADGHGDHVLGQALFVAHTGVVPTGVDVDKGVIHVDFDTHPRVKTQKTRQQVRQQKARHRHGHIELQGADRTLGVVVQIVERGVDLLQRRAQALE